MDEHPTFRILGQLEVEGVDGLGGPRQRSVLAALLLDAGRVVSADALVAAVWGPDAPATAVRTLRSYVSRLRALLGADVVRTEGWGYVIETRDVDAIRFRELVEQARADADAGLYRKAERLWRGRPLADLPEIASHPGVARLEELRLAAREDRLALEPDVVELEQLVADHPFRERLWELLIVALYRAGRQAEALGAFARVRQLLDDELGVEPRPALQQLQRQVLNQEVPEALPPTNLPASFDELVGRDRELADVEALLRSTRLVTLTGIGGGGKTRLAVEAARRAAGRYVGGTWLVELAAVADPNRVPDAIADAVRAVDAGGGAIESAGHRLADALLVIDNAEHVLAAAADAATKLLGAVSSLHVVVTSRQPLGVPGETVFVLPPLGVDAVELFARRVAEARTGVALSDEERAEGVAICQLLDGIPLAIELTAARARMLSITEIRRQVSGAGVLGWPGGARPQRHRTLRNAIDWSRTLLDAETREAFPRLSVFAGAFTADAAAEITGASLDVVVALVDASLLEARRGAPTRYRMLDTIRRYARELLPPDDEVAGRHARFFFDIAEAAAGAAFGPREDVLLTRVEDEHDEVRAALGWALAGGDTALGVRLARALTWFWATRGHALEGRAWLEQALPLAAGEERPALLGARGVVEFRLGRYADAQLLLEEAAEKTDDALAKGRWLHYLAGAHRNAGDDATARAIAARSLEAEREAGDLAGAAWTTGFLADTAQMAGDLETAQRLYDEGLELVRAAGDPPRLVVGYASSMSELALRCGDDARAEELARETLRRAELLGEGWHVALAQAALAEVARRRGALDEAGATARDALRHAWQIRETRVLADVVELLAVIAKDAGELEAAATLFGAVDGIRGRYGVRAGLLPTDAMTARRRLGEEFAATIAAGAALDEAEVVAIAASA